MALIEETGYDISALAGKFAPHADQNKYRSAWGVLEGTPKGGFQTVAELAGRQSHPHIRATSDGWAIFNDGKKQHVIDHQGMKLVEMIKGADELKQKQRLEQELATRNVEGTKAKGEAEFQAASLGISQQLQQPGIPSLPMDQSLMDAMLQSQANP